jgi:SPOR domain
MNYLKVKMTQLKILTLVGFLFILFGCGASTGSRYDESESSGKTETKNIENAKTDEQKPVDTKNVVEDFDINPYKTHININIKNQAPGYVPPDVWYGYENTEVNKSNNIIGTTDGYRVLVVSTDNLEKANEIRSEIYFKTQNKEVYISFEPPFYKVKVGDFTDRSEAINLKFKLNQLGYSEARVVQETVNIFSE